MNGLSPFCNTVINGSAVTVYDFTVHPYVSQLMTDEVKVRSKSLHTAPLLIRNLQISLGVVLGLTVFSVMLITTVLVARLSAANTGIKQ